MKVLESFRLDGRVALVTGGTRGLGKVMAEALAAAGASVAAAGRDLAQAQASAEAIEKSTGARAIGVSVEVSRMSDVEGMVKRVLDEFGRIDILVNNAGINIRGSIEELEESEWDQVLDINLKGPWLTSRAVARAMKAERWGRVINVSSMLGEVSIAGRTPYASSKGGLNLLTKTLALEWAPWGINVNAIAPGPFATEMNLPLLENPELRALFESKIPLGRWGRPEELGPLAVFLASEASSFITGTVITIDGGYTAQ